MFLIRFLNLDQIHLLSAKARQLIVAFTLTETVILTLWLDALDLVRLDLIPQNDIIAAVILFAGLLVEHLVAGVSGKV